MNKKCVLLSIFILIMLSACGQHQQNLDNVDTTNLSQLENVRASPLKPSDSSTQLSNLRIKLLQDSAMSIGAQGGLAWASDQMNAKMNRDRKYLDTIFNFSAMILTHGVIPPVLEAGDNSLNLDDPNTIRVADKTYKIVRQARFATTPPNWREYLWFTYSKPPLPDKSLLPRTSYEQNIWKKSIRSGWDKGIAQSYSIFQQNLARLKRDYRGMILYRKLLQEKMISPPFVARTELGITGNGTDMRINDQVLRIVEHPKLQTNSKGWRAVVIKNNE
ncbi:MAG: type IV secretory system conjugative DNA transfer family protein [Gammaproteobacteria bacterium]|nr:type IV secretory system conjugative DNA transfer family protein [Gammaproteobacteria bacterium]MCW5583288.1 type IV secretory system conjugative DNA transfer family protein [Gammaproteobacteria bacterium]